MEIPQSASLINVKPINKIRVKNMCLVDSSTTVDIDSGELSASEYYCLECKNRFKALGKRIRCPGCMSTKVKKV